MTRRDTIIAAALVNAGLLVVLFISAVKNEPKSDPLALEPQPSLHANPETPHPRERKKPLEVDEVEEVLKRYARQESRPSVPSPTVSEPASSIEDSPSVSLEPVRSLPPVVQPSNERPPEKPPSSRIFEVEVKKGDVLEKIAKEHRTTVSDIMKLNRLSSTRLKVGQKLQIESGTSRKESIPISPSSVETAQGSAKYYTIKAGDNLWTIAVRNHSKVEDLLKLNDLSEEKAKKLKPGDTIRIR